MSNPNLEAAKATGPAKNVVASVLDDKPYVMLRGKLNRGRYVLHGSCINSVARIGSNVTCTRSLASGGIYRRTGVVDGIAKSDGVVGLKAGIRPL